MLTFEQIYDSIPFEDKQGNIIPHDKVAKEAAYQFGRNVILEITEKCNRLTDLNKKPLTGNTVNQIYSEAILETLKELVI